MAAEMLSGGQNEGGKSSDLPPISWRLHAERWERQVMSSLSYRGIEITASRFYISSTVPGSIGFGGAEAATSWLLKKVGGPVGPPRCPLPMDSTHIGPESAGARKPGPGHWRGVLSPSNTARPANAPADVFGITVESDIAAAGNAAVEHRLGMDEDITGTGDAHVRFVGYQPAGINIT